MTRHRRHYTEQESRFLIRAVRLRDRLTNKALAARLGRSMVGVKHHLDRLRESGALDAPMESRRRG